MRLLHMAETFSGTITDTIYVDKRSRTFFSKAFSRLDSFL